jgi:hypothetical protein
VNAINDAVTRALNALRAAWYAWFDDKARISELRKAEDAYAAAVRQQALADAVRVVEGYANAYPVDVWPETPFTDAQAASVMRLMVPRILRTLAQETPDGR